MQIAGRHFGAEFAAWAWLRLGVWQIMGELVDVAPDSLSIERTDKAVPVFVRVVIQNRQLAIAFRCAQ